MLNLIRKDLKEAMMAKDALRVSTLRMAVSAFTNEAITRGAGYVLTQSESEVVIKRMIKSREDSASQFKAAGRTENAESELKEIEILSVYLPKQMTLDELNDAIKDSIQKVGATSKKDMGKVMKYLTSTYGNTFDGKMASQKVQEFLA